MIKRIVKAPGFQPMSASAQSGDGTPATAFIETMEDMEPIEPVEPMALVPPCHGQGKSGQVDKLIERGAAGNGLAGKYPDSPQHAVLISYDTGWTDSVTRSVPG